MVETVVETVRAGGCEEIVVVLGHQREAVARALADLGTRTVENPHYADGLSTSIHAGVEAAAAGAAGYLFALADMPGLSAETVAALKRAFAEALEDAIVVPAVKGKRGNPVVFSATYAEELRQLTGDAGAQSLLDRHSDRVVELEVEDDGVLIDVDTPEAYRGDGDQDKPT